MGGEGGGRGSSDERRRGDGDPPVSGGGGGSMQEGGMEGSEFDGLGDGGLDVFPTNLKPITDAVVDDEVVSAEVVPPAVGAVVKVVVVSE